MIIFDENTFHMHWNFNELNNILKEKKEQEDKNQSKNITDKVSAS